MGQAAHYSTGIPRNVPWRKEMDNMRPRSLQTVAIMSPGDMGHAVGAVLRQGGLRVITCLEGRGQRTATLAEQAGIESVADMGTLVSQADVLLSILPPGQAVSLSTRVAEALRATESALLYVDCNAVSPQTVRAIGDIVTSAGGRFVDAGIIGGPPAPGRTGTRIYASGEETGVFAGLREHGLDVRVIGDEIGQASGLKMCYAALTKGLTALAVELLTAAKVMGLEEPLRAELRDSQSTLLGLLERSIPSMPPKAYRWVAEMEEIAATFAAVGLTPKMHQGAADIYRYVGTTQLARETPEARRRGTSLDEVVGVLAEALHDLSS